MLENPTCKRGFTWSLAFLGVKTRRLCVKTLASHVEGQLGVEKVQRFGRIGNPVTVHVRERCEPVGISLCLAHDVVYRNAADCQGVGDQRTMASPRNRLRA